MLDDSFIAVFAKFIASLIAKTPIYLPSYPKIQHILVNERIISLLIAEPSCGGTGPLDSVVNLNTLASRVHDIFYKTKAPLYC